MRLSTRSEPTKWRRITVAAERALGGGRTIAGVCIFHAAVTAFVLFDVIGGKRTFLFFHDACVQSFPWLTKIFDATRHGELALWDFNTLGGTSFVGELQPGALYPLAWIGGLLFMPGDPHGVDLFITLHFWLGAVAMHWLSRELGLDHASSALGAIVFAFASAVAFRAIAQPNLFAGLVYMPLTVLCCVRAVKSTTRWEAFAWVGAGAVPTSLSVLAGHVYSSILAMTAAAVGALVWTAASEDRGAARFLRAMRSVVGIAVTATILAGPQIYAAEQYFGLSYRWYGPGHTSPGGHTVPFSAVSPLVLQPEALRTIWKGEDFSPPDEATLFFTKTGLIVGSAGLLVAALGRRRDKAAMLLGPAIMGVSLVLAFGMRGTLGRILYAIPILNVIRSPARYAHLFALGAAIFSAVGSAAVISAVRKLSPLIASGLAIAVVVGAAIEARNIQGARLRSTDNPEYPAQSIYANPLVHEMTRLSVGEGLRYRFFASKDLVNANVGDVLPIFSTAGFRSSSRVIYHEYFNFDPKSEHMDLLAVRWWLSDKPIDGLKELGRVGSTIIYERPAALPVFWIAQPDGRPVPAPIERLDYTHNTVTVRLQEPIAGKLAFAQATFPGWTAVVDGKPSPVETEGIFLATSLLSPARVVAFRYHPAWFIPLSGVSLLVLGGILCIIVFAALDAAKVRARASPSSDLPETKSR